ncbi:SigE family RNA polymerase sigma factor [Kribbella sp. NPDC051770]|uniref:SigE family RNA polymerase sigma factor n=1 Tax=Kribbella sp. NPDC051770 TaxID=3155413 RepID=UPI00342DCED9
MREDFAEFVVARQSQWLRTAHLLSGDRQFAEDIVQQSLEKLYVVWPKVVGVGAPDAYVRKMILNVYLSETRRAWRRRERTSEDVAPAVVQPGSAPLDDRIDLVRALGALPRRQRAALILRFAEDLSVAETAAVMGCAEGTVKAHTAAGIKALRRSMDLHCVGVTE